MTAPRKYEMSDGTFVTARQAMAIFGVNKNAIDHYARTRGTLKGFEKRATTKRDYVGITPEGVTLADAPAEPGAQADRIAATAPRYSAMIGEAVPRAAKPDCPRMAAVVATIRECRDAYLAEAR